MTSGGAWLGRVSEGQDSDGWCYRATPPVSEGGGRMAMGGGANDEETQVDRPKDAAYNWLQDGCVQITMWLVDGKGRWE